MEVNWGQETSRHINNTLVSKFTVKAERASALQ